MSSTANRVQAFLGRAKIICSNSESQDRVSPQQSSMSPKLRDRAPQASQGASVPSVSISRVAPSTSRTEASKSGGYSTSGGSPLSGKLSPSNVSPKNTVSPLRSNFTAQKDNRLNPHPKSLSEGGLNLNTMSPLAQISKKQQAKDSISELESLIESLSRNSVALHSKMQDSLQADNATLENILSILEKEKPKAANSDRSVEM